VDAERGSNTMTDADDAPVAFARRHPALADRLAATGSLLLGLDFDGTLAPIVPSADEATIRPRSRRWLRALAGHPSVAVAVISGRAVDDLVGRVGLDRAVYAGNHGLEFRYGERSVVHPGAAAHRETVRTVAERLADRAGEIPGCHVEDKALTLTVHYRKTPPHRRDDVRAMVETVVATVDSDLRVTAGKEIREIRPPVEWDKGSAISALASAAPDATTAYVGDDLTDEDVFEAFGPDDVGVRVGPSADTAATHELPDTSHVAALLRWLSGTVSDAETDTERG
jgi:trehalose 6-phosphate phosphatase